MFSEYKHMTQGCVDIFVLDLSILYSHLKAYQILSIFFCQIIFLKNDDVVLNYFKNGWST